VFESVISGIVEAPWFCEGREDCTRDLLYLESTFFKICQDVVPRLENASGTQTTLELQITELTQQLEEFKNIENLHAEAVSKLV
jgi:hypothetical protein